MIIHPLITDTKALEKFCQRLAAQPFRDPRRQRTIIARVTDQRGKMLERPEPLGGLTVLAHRMLEAVGLMRGQDVMSTLYQRGQPVHQPGFTARTMLGRERVQPGWLARLDLGISAA